MRSPFQTPFAAVFWNEVLVNTKRVAPYALMIFFSSNAILWWGWGPAVQRGWATNSDFYIYRNTGGFNFVLGLPIFTAIMMGDIVIRDFRLGVDPLIFSKPVGRASYLLGKFFGNFFVLVCCQSAFAITFCLLQWVPFSGMVKLPVQILPYFKHFFFVIVVSHLVLAAFYFAVGTISRNAKIVYGLAACFYPAYVASQLLWKNLPSNVRILFDPVAFNFHTKDINGWSQTADFLNKHVVSYGPYAYANRALMLVYSAIFLFIVYRRFATHEQTKLSTDHFTILTLPRASDTVPLGLESAPSYGVFDSAIEVSPARDRIPLPKVNPSRGPRTTLFKIFAAMVTEFRLLRAERSLIVLIPLIVVLSVFDLAFFRVEPEISYSITYASGTAKALLLFLVGLIIFFTGEAMHRDREVKVRPIVWSTPAPNSVFLLSKCFATALLALALVAVVGLLAIVIQVLRGHTPVDFTAYVIIYGVVVAPSVVFMTAMVVALNALLRNKYATYVVAVGTAAGLLYLYNVGYNHWLYNPLLYRLWTYADLTSTTLLTRRLYCLGLAAACLALAHLVFERKR
jgi:ABC-type transport system involved in multi-copper enzyme maturation permease subunit